MNEVVLLSCVINAQEHRDIATIDIPNAFIQTRVEKIKDMATIIVRGALVNVLVDISPDIYGPYVSTDKKGVKTMVLRKYNAIYVTVIESLLYYKKICKTIKHIGFTINPYDPFVANRTIVKDNDRIFLNIIRQMNAKFGGDLWRMSFGEEISNQTMLVGIDVCHKGK